MQEQKYEPSEETLKRVREELGISSSSSSSFSDGEQEKRSKFQKKYQNATSKPPEKMPSFAAGAQILVFVTDFQLSKQKPNSNWRRVRGIIYGDKEDLTKKEVLIPHFTPGENKKKIQQCMEGALCKAMGVASIPKRDPWARPIGTPIEFSCFDESIRRGTLYWVTGAGFELAPKKSFNSASEEDPSLETKTGDIIPELVAADFNHYKDISPQEILDLLSNENLFPKPCHLLPYGGKAIPYPEVEVYPDEISWKKESNFHTPVPFSYTNEVLFSHIQIKPSVCVHLCNKFKRLFLEGSEWPEGEQLPESGPIKCTMIIPENRNWLFRETLNVNETVSKPVIATPKDCDLKGFIPLTVADPRVEEQATIYTFIWESGVMEISGVQFAETWIKFGTQIIRGLDAVLEIVVNKRESRYDEKEQSFTLKGTSVSIPLVNYHETFRWCGAKISYDQAYQMAHKSVLGKQWEQAQNKKLKPWNGHAPPNAGMSQASLKLVTNDKSVKIVCLAEVTGDMNQLFKRDEWDFYAVPPNDLFSEPEPGEYLELLGFYKMKDPSEFLASYGDKCAVFAIRKDVN
jgi:hypothetical protein